MISHKEWSVLMGFQEGDHVSITVQHIAIVMLAFVILDTALAHLITFLFLTLWLANIVYGFVLFNNDPARVLTQPVKDLLDSISAHTAKNGSTLTSRGVVSLICVVGWLALTLLTWQWKLFLMFVLTYGAYIALVAEIVTEYQDNKETKENV